jgi:hypothetical protein
MTAPAFMLAIAETAGRDLLDPGFPSGQSCGCFCRCSRGLARVVSTWAVGDIRASHHFGQPAWDRFGEPDARQVVFAPD